LAKSAHYGRVVMRCVESSLKHTAPEALLPHRKEPIDASMTRSILSMPSGTNLEKHTVNWDQPFWTSWAAFMCVGMDIRKAVLNGKFLKGGLSPWNTKWLLNGET